MNHGLFGGAFNPVHHGHLIVAQHLVQSLELDRLDLVPTYAPPHRDEPTASFTSRVDMLKQATEDNPVLTVSTVESELEEPTYSYKLLNHYREKYPDRSLLFFVGMDELISFKDWKQWNKILDRFNVVGIERPGYSMSSVPEEIREKIELSSVPRIEISATNIRNRVKSGEAIRYFTPQNVIRYIQSHSLYSGD
ncbi:MAG: nicotinate (nicotinamide) nucleotide adenylyltransferase [bacterium]